VLLLCCQGMARLSGLSGAEVGCQTRGGGSLSVMDDVAKDMSEIA
jgi:hypothetical protein